jgi:hypothetical protein
VHSTLIAHGGFGETRAGKHADRHVDGFNQARVRTPIEQG